LDGLRDQLGKKGFVIDMDVLLTPQGVVSGGRSTGGDFWGNAEYTLNIDTGKLGLWPGGFLKFAGNTGFGSNAFRDSGATVPVNTAALLPAPDDRTTVVTNATLMQFLSPQFGLCASVTNWLNATADLQIIDPALKKVLNSSGGIVPRLTNVDTAVVIGARLYARF
jgi:porin